MKRISALLLAVLFVLSLAACSSAKPESETTADASTEAADTQVTGGWAVTENEAAALPKEVQTAFDKATAEYTGMDFVPVAYIGSQVVAGLNYAVLCESTTVTADPVTALKVVIIYADLQDNAEITNVADFTVSDYTDNAGKTRNEILAGGWSAPKEVGKAVIPAEAQSAYDKATESFEGNSLDLMALLGTQIVAGTNYAFLCHSTIASADPALSVIQVVTVYEDLDGNASITNICTLDIADFNQSSE